MLLQDATATMSDWIAADLTLGGHRQKFKLLCYSSYPSANLWKITQWKAAFIRDMSIGEQRDVGDGIVADEEVVLCQMVFHDFECGPAAVAFGC